ncbi:MAG: hypothetical protein WD602_03115 [Actinomycetota bacterium]
MLQLAETGAQPVYVRVDLYAAPVYDYVPGFDVMYFEVHTEVVAVQAGQRQLRIDTGKALEEQLDCEFLAIDGYAATSNLISRRFQKADGMKTAWVAVDDQPYQLAADSFPYAFKSRHWCGEEHVLRSFFAERKRQRVSEEARWG